eukprot:1159316-Pelagomonas_calceolata.AAC.3
MLASTKAHLQEWDVSARLGSKNQLSLTTGVSSAQDTELVKVKNLVNLNPMMIVLDPFNY